MVLLPSVVDHLLKCYVCVCVCVRWEGGRKGEGEKSRVRKAGRMEGEEEDSGK